MHPLAPFLAVPLLIGAAITFALGIYAWGRRGEPGVTAFLFTSVGLAAWSIFYSLEIMSAEFETKLFWHKMVYTMLVLVPGPWALFLYQYDTRTKRLPPWLPWALAVEPVLFVLLTWTNGALHTLVWRSVTLTGDVPDLEFVRGPFFWVHTLYSYLLILIATYFFTRMLWHEPKLPRWQVAVLALAAFFPLIINFIHVMQLHPFYPLDLTPFALATMGTAASWYAFRFEIWDFLPAAHNVIVESMNDGMIVLDVEQTVVEINPAALELLGMQRSDAIGRPVAAILPSWETVYTHHKEAMTPWELVLPSEPDKRYVDLVYSNLYSRNHRLTGALLTLRNVTARKLAEQALAEERTLLAHRVNEQTADLRKANGELARVAKMKDEFLANMSHELRTPLNTILGLSEALQEQVYGPLGERQVRALRNVEESGRHLLTLINDILDVSKIEAGKLSLELQAVSADSVCQASLGLVRQMAHKKQIEVLYTPDPMVAVLQADERRLKQILVNLLSNAVKFTPEGGKIGLEVKGDRTQEAINFTVWDTGVGIASEDLQRLFQPFVQLDSRLSRYHDGSGLGLVLVYRMTQLHGGSVGVSSAVGAGSRFTVSLPWREPMMPAFMQSAAETEALLTQMRRVLLVDNSPTTIDQVRRYLLELGAETIVLPDSVDPVETARREQPDLIIMDVVFSDQPSTQILSDLRRCPETSVIPVLVLSVVADSVLSNMPIDDGQQRVYHLLKPISRQQLSQGLVRAMLQPPQTVDQPPAPTLLEGPNDGCQPVILIVEDNETNIRTLVDYLGAKHYRLEVARSGTEAIALLRQIQADLVLMDIQMPNMDGIEVIRLIRSELGLASLPIIAVTALAMPGDREKTLAAGANDYLSKPVSLKRLVALVEQYICRGEHEQQ